MIIYEILSAEQYIFVHIYNTSGKLIFPGFSVWQQPLASRQTVHAGLLARKKAAYGEYHKTK